VYLPELLVSDEKVNGSIFIRKQINEKVPVEALHLKEYHNEELQLMCIKTNTLGFISIWNNKDIEMTPPPFEEDAYLRMLILGSVAMILSNCFGQLSLHAATVVVNNKAYVFCAKSGRGKSSIAAYFYSKGYRVLSDDVTNIYINKTGEAIALSSVPRIKLSKEALKKIGQSHDGLDVIPGYTTKYSLPMKQISKENEFPIDHLFFPEFDDQIKVENTLEIRGRLKLKEITAHIYRPRLGMSLPMFKHKQTVLFNIISTVEMFHIIRPSDQSKMNQSLAYIENKILNSTCQK
jgi:hypothetical protein